MDTVWKITATGLFKKLMVMRDLGMYCMAFDWNDIVISRKDRWVFLDSIKPFIGSVKRTRRGFVVYF